METQDYQVILAVLPFLEILITQLTQVANGMLDTAKISITHRETRV